MNWTFIIVILFLLFGLELLYFRVATYYNIVDKPNYRSSHTNLTIRGGGVIFSIGMLLCPLFFVLNYPYFLTGLFIVALISFFDDIHPVSSKVRIIFHLIGTAFLFIQLHIFELQLFYVIIAAIIVIGLINAVNFMDGINGITGIYSLVALCTLYYINYSLKFSDKNYLEVSILSVIVFNFFNCRKKAVCFAGDVGSVAIAFIIAFFLFQLIIKTQNINYILLLLIYGLDTATTIMFRLIRREKITEAHRSHFYQYLANEKRYPHLFVAFLYGLSQLLINIAVISYANLRLPIFAFTLTIATLSFLALRIFMEGKKRLLKVNFKAIK